MDERFRKVEDEYFRLKGQLQAGRITHERFETALKGMMVQDAQGRYWMLGVDDAKWYMHDGSAWIEAMPPVAIATTFSPLAPSVAPPQPRTRNDALLFAVGGIAVLFLLGAAAFLFAASQGLFSSKANPVTPTSIAIATAPPADVNAVQTQTARNIFATQTASAPTTAPSPSLGGRIAFVSTRALDGPSCAPNDLSKCRNQIYVMNPDGSDPRRISDNTANDMFPAWSPDARSIAFVRSSPAVIDPGSYYTMNLDGTGIRKLADRREFNGGRSSWSPDGRFIAYDDSGIFLINADGTNRRRLTDNDNDMGPAWSPDGRSIAFERVGSVQIYVMNADGSNRRRLTDPSDGFSQFPAWSPDGKFFAFESIDFDHPPIQIYVMNADGSNRHRLTDPSSGKYNGGPSWSPDGRFITFHSDRDGTPQIYVMNADGTNPRRLTDGPSTNMMPAWSRK